MQEHDNALADPEATIGNAATTFTHPISSGSAPAAAHNFRKHYDEFMKYTCENKIAACVDYFNFDVIQDLCSDSNPRSEPSADNVCSDLHFQARAWENLSKPKF